ncbi:MAG TPA: hypothetical protein VFJ14_10610 [Nocardioidaceae bacterium]|nr:hypothetical protein [Nocardioidaceae bacterium]
MPAGCRPRVRSRLSSCPRRGVRESACSSAFRLLDLGLFRIGGGQYVEDNGSFGLATLRREHVRISGGAVAFDYPAKGGQERQQEIVDDDVSAVLRGLLRRRHESAELLAYQRGRRWCDVRSEVSHYLGNTPTVAKKSYVDPRIVDLYHDGTTVRAALECAGRDGDRGTPLLHGDVERAVLRMLAGA